MPIVSGCPGEILINHKEETAKQRSGALPHCGSKSVEHSRTSPLKQKTTCYIVYLH